jgi:DNA-binding transcriptional LysR family regulator
MVYRSIAKGPTASLEASRSLPAASRLAPTLLLALQAFEVAVRLGSFKAAAEAMHLTPSAVSHRIRDLERRLGRKLFVRSQRNVEPTAFGKTLAGSTGRAFSELERATEPASARHGRRRLRIATLPTFASSWLLPRINGFMDAHRDIELVLENATGSIDVDAEPFDASIRVGNGDWAGFETMRLMDVRTTPVATRSLIERLSLRHPADLARTALIHVNSYPAAWSSWLHHAGADGVEGRQAIWVDTFDAAAQAAGRGTGVALGLDPFIDEGGVLCRPFKIWHSTGGYWLVHRPAEAGNPPLKAFKRWLADELSASRRGSADVVPRRRRAAQ